MSFLTCAFFYCCRACGLCGGSEPRAEPYTKKEKRDVLIVLVVALIMCRYCRCMLIPPQKNNK